MSEVRLGEPPLPNMISVSHDSAKQVSVTVDDEVEFIDTDNFLVRALKEQFDQLTKHERHLVQNPGMLFHAMFEDLCAFFFQTGFRCNDLFCN